MRPWVTIFAVPVTVIALAMLIGASLALWVDSETNAANTLGTDTLAAPTSLTASDAPPGSVTLNWTPTASTWAADYNVQRSTTSGCCYGFLAAVPGQSSSSYVDPVGGGGFETVTFMTSATHVLLAEATNITIAAPAGIALDDLLLAVLVVTKDRSLSAPAGWTLIEELPADGDKVTLSLWYKVASASEPADYQFSWSDDQAAIGAIYRYDGVDPASPIDASASGAGKSPTPIAPTVTTTVANAMVVRAMGSSKPVLPAPASDVHPAGTTGRHALETGLGDQETAAGADATQVSAGASGAALFNLAEEQEWAAATVALTPNFIPPTTYYYVVEAYFQNWTSPFSNEASGDGDTPVVARIGTWGTGTSHSASAGSNRALVFVAGREHFGSQPTLTSVTYGGQALTQVISQDSGTSPYDSVEIWILNEAGIAAASGSAFVPTWRSAPDQVRYAHAFYEDVNQAALTAAQPSNSTDSATPNPITTSALANTNGDMVIVGVTAGNPGAYTAQNGFSLGVSTSFGSTATLGTAEKSATGSAETPSMQHDGPNRQAIAAFVLQAAP